MPTVNFARSSKGTVGNGGASRVWKGEIAQIAFAVGHSFGVPFFVFKISETFTTLI